MIRAHSSGEVVKPSAVRRRESPLSVQQPVLLGSQCEAQVDELFTCESSTRQRFLRVYRAIVIQRGTPFCGGKLVRAEQALRMLGKHYALPRVWVPLASVEVP